MDKRQTRAFEGFAAESGAELLRIATVLTSDPHTAEDVYQETLQRLAARWPRVDNPKAFCRRVMYHIVVDQIRASARRPRELRLHDEGERSDPRAGGRHDSVELWPTLRTALDSLTVQQRTVIALRYLDDCSAATTAGWRH
jgi:RNA polymerase sigma factor (sigma-70 family)